VKERVQYFRLHERRLLKDSIVWHEDVDTSKGLTLWGDRPEELSSKFPKTSFRIFQSLLILAF
jgi:hypothetical protein